MIKLLAFDIDGTLAKTEEAIHPHISAKLRDLEDSKLQIVLISGRTASYLAGLARGMGLKRPLVAGENGGVVFNPLNLWEQKLDVIPEEVIQEMKAVLLRKFKDIWFQPNQTMLTAAPKDLSRIDELYEVVLSLEPVSRYDFKLHKYYDAVEVLPKKNSKGKALAVIKRYLGLKTEEVIAIGNTIVDIPMKPEAKEFLFIGDSIKELGIQNFHSIEDALVYLEEASI